MGFYYVGKNSDIWDKADIVLMDYTNGWFPDLCRTYAEAHFSEKGD